MVWKGRSDIRNTANVSYGQKRTCRARKARSESIDEMMASVDSISLMREYTSNSVNPDCSM